MEEGVVVVIVLERPQAAESRLDPEVQEHCDAWTFAGCERVLARAFITAVEPVAVDRTRQACSPS